LPPIAAQAFYDLPAFHTLDLYRPFRGYQVAKWMRRRQPDLTAENFFAGAP
jgi:hypothetical protein